MCTPKEMATCIEALSKVNALKTLVGDVESLKGSTDLLMILELAIIHRLLNIEEGKETPTYVH